jgi:Tol biopolymer transport system component
MTALWPDTFVEEANLSFQVSTLRKALGDGATEWIETIPKHGYRFTPDVRTIVPADSTPASGADVESGSPPQSAATRARWSRAIWLLAVGAGCVLAAVFYVAGLKRTPGVTTFPARSATPLTSYPGLEVVPSLSPDGSQVAFAWDGPTRDNFDIYVKLTGPGEPWRLTTNPARDAKPAWSPDGHFIAFQRYVTESTVDVVVIPALGGAERKVASIVAEPWGGGLGRELSALAWAPDSRWLAFSSGPSDAEPQGIWVTAIGHPETRRLTRSSGQRGDLSPTFSHDGRRLAFIRETTFSQSAIYVLQLSPGLTAAAPPAAVTSATSTVLGVAWTPDSRSLVFSSGGHLGMSRLQTVTLEPGGIAPSGRPELLSFGEQATALTISRTGRLVYATQSRDTNLRRLDLSSPERGPLPLALAPSTFDEQTPDFSSDGRRLAFASTRSGVEEIWISGADGSNPVQVTFTGGPQCSNPQWSPADGRIILFDSRRQGTADLYRLNVDSGELRRITSHPGEELQPRWSRDGRAIYFGSNRTGRLEIWKMPADGGEAVRVTGNGGSAASESTDGRFLYYAKTPGPPISIWRIPVGGGEETPVLEGLSHSLNFVVADRGLYFVAVGNAPEKTSLDFFDFRTGRRSTLLGLGQRFWYGTALSPDQRTLLYSMVDVIGSNLMVVDGFGSR